MSISVKCTVPIAIRINKNNMNMKDEYLIYELTEYFSFAYHIIIIDFDKQIIEYRTIPAMSPRDLALLMPHSPAASPSLSLRYSPLASCRTAAHSQ